jgi:hypothetical protein
MSQVGNQGEQLSFPVLHALSKSTESERSKGGLVGYLQFASEQTFI